jgi:hypothetical protein
VLVGCGVLGLVFWSNPISMGTLAVPGGWGWAVPGYACALGTLLAGLVLRRTGDRRVALAGGLLAVPAFGYALAALGGILVAALSRRVTGTTSTVPGALRMPAFRKSVVFMLHFALVLGLVGYAFATYASQETATAVRIGQDAATPVVAGYAFQVLDTQRVGIDPSDGGPEEIRVDVAVFDGAERLGTATLVFWKVPDGTPWHYDGKTTVVRLADRDLYLFPHALWFGQTELPDHSEAVRPPEGEATGADVTLKVLPGVGLVWTGLWSVTALMATNLAVGGFTIVWGTMAATHVASSSTARRGLDGLPPPSPALAESPQ